MASKVFLPLGLMASVVLSPLSAYFVVNIFTEANAESPVWFFIVALGFVPGAALSAIIASLDDQTSYRYAFELCGVVGLLSSLVSCTVGLGMT